MKGWMRRLDRLRWLVRRLSRMAPGEVPHRVGSMLRMGAQRLGLFDARQVPPEASDARDGRPWCAVPAGAADASLPQWPAPDRATSANDPRAAAAAAVLPMAQALLWQGPTVFGVPTPGRPLWNADPRTGLALPMRFGLFIDFRSLPSGIDIKHLWELNRHVWWIALAQAWALTHDPRYLERLRELLDDWLQACPYPLGPNWSSPVEHGIRLIAWSLVWQLVGGHEGPLFEGHRGLALRDRWLTSVWQHMRFALDNESQHSSANNHLIGEAAGVFVAAHTWDRWPATRSMRVHAKQVLEREILRQFAADGLNLEQANCYHKFALQFVVAAALCGRANGDALSAQATARIGLAARAMAAQMDVRGRMPAVGDADDGDVFRLDWREAFDHYRSLLALAARLGSDAPAWSKAKAVGASADIQCLWLQPGAAPDGDGEGDAGAASALQQLPCHLPQGGVLLLGDKLHARDEWRVQFDVGPLGFNRISGHGHADALAVQMSVAGQPLLVDAGTYCYNTEPEWRRHFRGTAAHNTLMLDGRDQADYGGPFLWLSDVHCTLEELADNGVVAIAQASHDGYLRLTDPVRHHRRLTLDRAMRCLRVEDWIDAGTTHEAAWHWQLAPDASMEPAGEGIWCATVGTQRLSIRVHATTSTRAQAVVRCGQETPACGWVSSRFYERRPAPCLQLRGRLAPAARLVTEFVLIG